MSPLFLCPYIVYNGGGKREEAIMNLRKAMAMAVDRDTINKKLHPISRDVISYNYIFIVDTKKSPPM